MNALALTLALSAASPALAEEVCGTEPSATYTETLEATLATEEQIGEMADRIGVMADRIGEMADRIVTVTELSQANALAMTQLLTSSEVQIVPALPEGYVLVAVPASALTTTTQPTSFFSR
ncbi:MAG: hypothetical protein JXX28_12235 [Deltaproteobacteria bacterium]|nr:hypothetical protein [Deltaproteobacteria bacterium]